MKLETECKLHALTEMYWMRLPRYFDQEQDVEEEPEARKPYQHQLESLVGTEGQRARTCAPVHIRQSIRMDSSDDKKKKLPHLFDLPFEPNECGGQAAAGLRPESMDD